MKRHLYNNDFDTFSAESEEEAVRMHLERDGDEGETFHQVPDNKPLTVTFHDGMGPRESTNPKYPDWVDGEPEAVIDWAGGVAIVTAPARVWAHHMTGMVCSTEY